MAFNSIPGWFRTVLNRAGADLAPWMSGETTKIPASAIEGGGTVVTDPNPPWEAAAGLEDTVGQSAIFAGEKYTQTVADQLIEDHWQLTTSDTAAEVTVAATPSNYSTAGSSTEQHLAGIDVTLGAKVEDLQGAHDAAPLDGIRGRLVTASVGFLTGFVNFFSAIKVMWATGTDSAIFAVGGSGQEIAHFNESLIDPTDVTIPATNEIDFAGIDLTTLDAGLGVQLAGATQFPSLVIAFTDARGIQILAALTVVDGTGTKTKLTLIAPPPGTDTILTTDTTKGGTLQCALLKRISTIGADGIVGFTGKQQRLRGVTSSETIRSDDYLVSIDANNVEVTLPSGERGDEFIVFNGGTFTNLTIIADGGGNINGSASDLVISGSFGVVNLRRLASGDWIASGGGVAGVVSDSNILQNVTSLKTSGTYAILDTDENIVADTNGAVVTLTLPGSPVTGQTHRLTLLSHTNTLTIGRNGNSIDGVAADNTTLLAGDITSVTLQFHSTASIGWVVIATS